MPVAELAREMNEAAQTEPNPQVSLRQQQETTLHPLGQDPTTITSSQRDESSLHNAQQRGTDPPSSSHVLTTLFSWPELEPTRFAWYHPQLLSMPLRRDILHRAVIYEADATRAGTASTKWRSEVRGSGRKLYRQKGTGKARVGDKNSPIRRGGGIAFGPHPRDFSTELNRKIYDIAWRTALSYRYRRGELVVIDPDSPVAIPRGTGGRLLSNIFEANHWGKADGRSLLVTQLYRKRLFEGMDTIGEHGLVKDLDDVDVKDLLETGRIIIEKNALDTLLVAHASDLGLKRSLEAAFAMDKSFLQGWDARSPVVPTM